MRAARVAAHVHSSWSYDAEWSLQDIAQCVPAPPVRRRAHVRARSQLRSAAAGTSTRGVPGGQAPTTSCCPRDRVRRRRQRRPYPGVGRACPLPRRWTPTLELLRAAHDEGAVAVLAHPWRRNAISRYQPEWAPLLSAVEIWNRKVRRDRSHRKAAAGSRLGQAWRRSWRWISIPAANSSRWRCRSSLTSSRQRARSPRRSAWGASDRSSSCLGAAVHWRSGRRHAPRPGSRSARGQGSAPRDPVTGCRVPQSLWRWL